VFYANMQGMIFCYLWRVLDLWNISVLSHASSVIHSRDDELRFCFVENVSSQN